MRLLKINKIFIISLLVTLLFFILKFDKNDDFRKLYTQDDVDKICRDYNYTELYEKFYKNKTDFPNYNTSYSDMLIKYTISKDSQDLTEYAIQRYIPFIIILAIIILALLSI